jgi:hypothetical protein
MKGAEWKVSEELANGVVGDVEAAASGLVDEIRHAGWRVDADGFCDFCL